MFTSRKHLITSLGLFVFVFMATLVSATSASAQVDPGPTAFHESIQLLNDPNNTWSFKAVPANQRLVIERLTVEIKIPHNVLITRVMLETFVNFDGTAYLAGFHILPQPTLNYTHNGVARYSLFLTPDLYADGGAPNFKTPPILLIDFDQKVPINGFLSISGHLVCPRILTCPAPVRGSLKGVEDKVPTVTSATDTTAVAQTRPRFAKPTTRETIGMARGQ